MADMKKRQEHHPFEERRLGWISKLPDYHPVCLGQSAKDLRMNILF